MAEDDPNHGNGAWPREADVGRWTDTYFNRTKTTVEAHGDCGGRPEPLCFEVFVSLSAK